jgi:hypothetical protein
MTAAVATSRELKETSFERQRYTMTEAPFEADFDQFGYTVE